MFLITNITYQAIYIVLYIILPMHLLIILIMKEHIRSSMEADIHEMENLLYQHITWMNMSRKSNTSMSDADNH